LNTLPDWLAYLTALGALATPVLLAILGAIGWKLRNGIERRFELERTLRDDRVEIYNQILEPIIVLFMSDAAWKADPKNKTRDKNDLSTRQLLSLDYKKTGFRLSLFGSDGVVRAYNELLQHFYQAPDAVATEDRTRGMLERVGTLLLEIRKSTGNENTELDRWQMLEWFITDARKYRGVKV